MRKDAMFIFVVLIVGLGVVYYSNQNTNDTLQDIRSSQSQANQNQTERVNRPAAVNTNALGNNDIQTRIKIPTGYDGPNIAYDRSEYGLDVDLSKIDTAEALESFEDASAGKLAKDSDSEFGESRSETEEAKNKKGEFDWNTEFASWTLTLLDNATGLTGVIDLSSETQCQMTFFFADNKITNLNLRAVAKVSSAGNSVAFAASKPFNLSYLKNAVAVRIAAARLVDLCS